MYWPVGTPNVYSLSRQAAKVTKSEENTTEPASPGSPSPQKSVAPGKENGEDADAADETNGELQEQSAAGKGEDAEDAGEIIAARISRGGSVFITITRTSLTVWQTKPTVALATVVRSAQSLKSYGPNTALLLRPDGLIVVVQTALGYLITFSMATDPSARVYHMQLHANSRHVRNDSGDGYSSYRRPNAALAEGGAGDGDGIREVNVRFRMVIRIDAGISTALALDDELIVATQKPAALQCIRWVADESRAQTSTEILSRLPWMAGKCTIAEMVYDRPMNLSCWITSDGRAYAVQRRSTANAEGETPAGMFRGFCFREADMERAAAVKATINARFSLIAIGCADGSVDVYAVKDYMGNIPLSHTVRLSVSLATSGPLTSLSFSPDGYCLLAGYEKGWAMWSVYGKPGSNSFGTDRKLSEPNGEDWLHGVKDGFWIGGGCELALFGFRDRRFWVLDIARNSASGCLSSSNIARGLLYTGSCLMLYMGHEVDDLTALCSDLSLWQTVQVPSTYLLHQWPLKSVVVSPDGKYVAVAGRRGVAHYSVASARWKTFEDPALEHDFAVRGGMCWHQHFLICCVENGGRYQVRVYSREKALDYTHVQHTEELSAPAVYITTSGSDSLLVYTHDNTLLHFIIAPAGSSVKLVQVGQIGFHGIIRAPPRVRAISWILPEDQLEHGDPSQDVATASVLFLVDAKLVLLQPSTNEQGELKYDMRVIAQNVEFYSLLRDQPSSFPLPKPSNGVATMTGDLALENPLGHSLRDSLWFFEGSSMHVWSDIQDVMACAPAELGRDLPPTVQVPIDFYPISTLVAKGVINGLDADLIQRRDTNFSFFRPTARTQLFLPQLLRHHLADYNSPAALHLSQSYQHLPYFAHALEVLLHDILDHEVDHPPSPPETALLPTAISFLSSFRAYLDIIVNCTRKTELRSWRTLFAHLPPVQELFEQTLAQDKLKTAAGYLLVLHTLEQDAFQVGGFARLLRKAGAVGEWELCRELARFLVGIDRSGKTLKAALRESGMVGGGAGGPLQVNGRSATGGMDDYFSFGRAGAHGGEKEQFITPGDA